MFSPDERINYAMAFMKFENKPLTFDFWQQEYVKSPARYICILKSRRVGFSFATGIKAIVKSNDPNRINYTKQFVSYNESDALEKIRYAEAFYDSMPKKVKKKIITRNKSCLEFQDVNSGTTSRLISLPCRPPRGKGGDICLDEMGIYQPRISQVIYTAALPVISRGGCIEVGSTPLGTIGRFYDLCVDKQKYPEYQRFMVYWWYCAALCRDVDGAIKEAKNLTTSERVYKFGTDTLIKQFENMDIDAFKQEFECEFVDSASSYISLELIYNNVPGMRDEDLQIDPKLLNVDDKDYSEEFLGREIIVFHDVDSALLNYRPEIHGETLYMGYDVAKNRDAVSIIILGIKNGLKRQFIRIEEHNKSFEWQKDTVRKLMHNLPIFRCDIDCTGMGAPIYEELKKEFGDRIEGYQFTLESKEPLAMGVKFSLEQKEFLLENDKGFHAQIHAIKQSPAIGKHFRYDAERSEGLHADSFWSLALANYAASKKTVNFYKEYAAKKNQIEVVSADDTINKADTTKVINSIRNRGKGLNAVMREIYKNNQ